ncbi:MAG: hypothetical protein MMC23_008488 [Stictis urceolatum]|nr:hypothetical protein [Stictis urceolata]
MSKNPFSDTSASAGHGEIQLSLLPPSKPSFKILSYTYPLKLVSSSPHILQEVDDKDKAARQRPYSVPLIFLLSYGGGLLPPDSLSVNITLDPYTRLTLTTQGSTKIFPSPPRDPPLSKDGSLLSPHVATQDLDVKLGIGSALLLSPDPSQPFKDSNYSQTQVIEVQKDSSLGLLDWITSGRPARGEVWDASSWKGRNEIWQAASTSPDGTQSKRRLILRDNVLLTGGPSGSGQKSLKAENLGVFGTFILYGLLFERMGTFFVDEFTAMPRIGGRDWGDGDNVVQAPASDDAAAVEEFRKEQELLAWRKERLRREKADGVIWTSARVRGLVLVKFGAREVEGAREWLGMMCRWEGTIATEFGPGGLMSLR